MQSSHRENITGEQGAAAEVKILRTAVALLRFEIARYLARDTDEAHLERLLNDTIGFSFKNGIKGEAVTSKGAPRSFVKAAHIAYKGQWPKDAGETMIVGGHVVTKQQFNDPANLACWSPATANCTCPGCGGYND